jgi:hypothetical protein
MLLCARCKQCEFCDRLNTQLNCSLYGCRSYACGPADLNLQRTKVSGCTRVRELTSAGRLMAPSVLDVNGQGVVSGGFAITASRSILAIGVSLRA